MSFRDDGDALLQRTRALEHEVDRLRQENRQLRDQLANATMPTDIIADPRLAAAIAAYRRLLLEVREALAARGERIDGTEYYVYPRARYDGFYVTAGSVKLFIGLHLGACLEHGLGPLVVQLSHRTLDEVAVTIGKRWPLHDGALLNWSEGPFVTLELVPGDSWDGHRARLVAELDALRDALKR